MLLNLLLWALGFIVLITLIARLVWRSQQKKIQIDPETKELLGDDIKTVPITGSGIETAGPIAPPREEINTGVIKVETDDDLHDDLTVIEGIGPAMQEILYERGIYSYDKLAQSDPLLLKEMLSEIGLKYIDPTTWPEQARWAQKGSWDRLNAYKESTRDFKIRE